MKKRYMAALTAVFSVFCIQTVTSQNEKIIPALYKDVDNDKMIHWVDSVYNTMSTDERIGQLFMPVVAGDNTVANKNTITSLVKNQHVGGLLFSKGAPVNQAELTNTAQKAAKIPLMISLDGEWGLSMRLENTTKFPRNMLLGAIQNDSLLYYYGLEVARQCKLMGIHVNFAPVMDVNSNPANPVIGTRSFGENPERVSRLGIMYSKGLEAGGVMAVSKHFPGHGDTSTDSHFVLPQINHTKERLDNVEIKPFRDYINAGLSGIMIAHLNIPVLDNKDQPSSLSKKIATGLLKDELGFSGLTFTDGLQMKGVSDEDNYCVRALLAGNDILLGPLHVLKEYEAVKKAFEDDILSEQMIEEKCKKVLSYKYILGIKDTRPIKTKNLLQELNTPNANWVNMQLHRDAMTLLKNDSEIIPLKELDQRKIAAISIGSTANNTFHSTLNKYGDVKSFNVANATELSGLKKTLEPYNTLIISVHSTKANANAAIREITKGKESILVFFVVPYRMSSYESSTKEAEGVILAYENTELAQDYAAQAIFGGNDVSGKIPVTVKGLFDEGAGFDVQKVRLGYGLPESVGISSDRLKGIDTIVYESIKEKAFPGCQVLIAKDGVVIYNKPYGSFTYDGKRKVKDTDIYDLASMTKASATVPAIMKLYETSKIKLNTPLSTYVPELKGTDKSGITVREALLHETGLSPFLAYYMDAIDTKSYSGKLFSYRKTATHTAMFDETTWVRPDYKFKPHMVSSTAKKGFVPLADNLYVSESYRDTLVAAIAKSKLKARKSYLYSCLNFMLLKEAAENVSKEDLNTYLQENFYKKLGATTTTYNPLTKFDKSRIAPTEKDDFLRKQLLQGYVHDEAAAFLGGVSGNAGLFSDANDLAKLYQMWLNNGVYGGERYLSEKTCQLFMGTKSSTSRRGLGFDKPDTRTNKPSPAAFSAPASSYGHTGFTGTCFWVDPDNDLIYIFLSNRVFEKRTHRKLMENNVRERVQEEIYKAMRKEKSQVESTKTESDTETDDEQVSDE